MRVTTIACVRGPEIDPSRATDIIRLPASGGEAQLIAHAHGARFLDFGREPNLIRFFTPEGVKTLRIDEPSSEPRRVVVILTRSCLSICRSAGRRSKRFVSSLMVAGRWRRPRRSFISSPCRRRWAMIRRS